MTYIDTLRPHQQNPQRLEEVYQEAQRNGQANEFAQAVQRLHTEAPEQLLWQAWFYRLGAQNVAHSDGHSPNWRVAIGLSLVCGVLFWLLSDFAFFTLVNEFPCYR
ncbi:MAG: hypothetical protein R3E79_16365 [Caldilineaceae bacterium]